MTERSTSDSLGDVSWIQKAALQLYRRNVPLLHMSRYVTARDSVLPGLPRVSTAATNAGVRRPGYEATGYPYAARLFLLPSGRQFGNEVKV